ncbi:MAG TPA: hypothetical protein VG796_06430 [Verrucomicrobiales bacterium]|jgi:hypothetical protein|nr:hypothetical protein [Verrucomicrobiales bacterium]
MRLPCLLLFCCGLLVLSCGKQEVPELPAAEMVTNLKRDATACASALQKKDYEGMIRYTHEKLARMVGGAKGFRAAIEMTLRDKDGNPMTFLSATIGEPGPIKKDGDRLLSLVPQNLVVKVAGGRLLGSGTLLGLSENGGRDWVFIDTAKMREKSFYTVFPELAGKMALPPKVEARFEKDPPPPDLPEDEMTDNLKRDAAASAKLWVEGNYLGVTRYMAPRLVKASGGGVNLSRALREAMKDEEGNEMAFEEAVTGEPGPIKKEGGLLLSFVPQKTVMKFTGGRLRLNGWALGISETGGRKWTFINPAQMKGDDFEKAFPELAGKIDVPPIEEPQIERD